MLDRIQRDKFWNRVNVGSPAECWNWIGAFDGKGYGAFANTVIPSHGAHRISFLLYHGSIPKGMHIHHTCHNRQCVNPAHLKAVTPAENSSYRVKGSGLKSKRHQIQTEILRTSRKLASLYLQLKQIDEKQRAMPVSA